MAWLVDRPLVVRAALSPGVRLAVVALSLALLAYRSWAIVDAYRVSRRRWGSASSTALRVPSLLALAHAFDGSPPTVTPGSGCS